MANVNLVKAKRIKNDEFYTQYHDIEIEVQKYVEYDPDVFRGKVVYCNCDDPFESNFFKFFANKFKAYGLKKLIATSYAGSPVAGTQLQLFDNKNTIRSKKAYKIIINGTSNLPSNGITNLNNIKHLLKHEKNASSLLHGDSIYAAGDFRSKECVELLKQADIVVTNPPFSLFREYIRQLMDFNKKFLVIGNMNAISYKEIFPLLKENKVWLGVNNGPKIYEAPNHYDQKNIFTGKDNKRYAKMGNTCWFTNLEHGRRHEPLPLMTIADNKKFNKQVRNNPDCYKKYDNYDAIEVPYVNAIPSDYKGVMGVPVSIFDKYCPEQFEIIGMAEDNGKGFSGGIWDGKNPHCVVGGHNKFKRIFIKHRRFD